MPHHPKRRRHSLDRAGQRRRRLRLRGLQQGADLGQVLQRGKLGGRTALGVAAIRQHLAGDFLRQEAQRARQEAGVLRQRDGCSDQALQCGERPRVQLLGRKRRRQAAGIGHQPAHQLLAECIVSGGGEEVVMAEPGGDPGADDIRAVRQRLAGRRRDPFGHQRAGAQSGGVGAEGAQVAQPGKAVRRGVQQRGAGRLAPGARTQRAHAAAELQLAPQQPGAAAGVARPRIAHRQRRRVRHTAHAQAWQTRDHAARIAQPAPRIGCVHAAASRAAQRRDRRGIVRRTEHRGAGDQRVGTGARSRAVPSPA